LSETIGSKETRTDFEAWKRNHPEAVEMLTSRAAQSPSESKRPLNIRNLIMKSPITKLAAAAVVLIAAAVGIHQLAGSDKSDIGGRTPTLVAGPKSIKLADGSQVRLAQGAQIQVGAGANKRGFEHIAGRVDVSVTRGKGQFVVRTAYGNVKALGTQFTLDMVDGVAANTMEKVRMLAVKVKEGTVEVSNARGATTLKETQRLVVEADSAPYDFSQDENLPARLRERIAAMVAAFEAGDARAWAANFNMDYAYKIVKGKVEYDPNLFGGSEADFERLKEAFGNVKDIREMSEKMLAGINITEPIKAYVRSAEVNEAGDHARVTCVTFKGENRFVVTDPQWHYFDNDWWQIDD
jgi:ferric-dicitrate binding protein FerR (iron transport regulator)